MEIHPHVRELMARYATSDDELQAWIDYHESVALEDVVADLEAEERDEIADLVGWDVDETGHGHRQGR